MAAKPRSVKTWIWVAVALVGLGILAIIVMAGVGLYFFTQHVETRTVAASEAADQFADVRKQFESQKPLIELDEDGEFLRSNPDRPASTTSRAPSALHVMAYDQDDGQIVRLSIPFWLLRLQKGEATIDLGGNQMDLEDLKLTVEDLERFGPTLIVDHQRKSGSRVLVWSQ
jgi:hypothetical protein